MKPSTASLLASFRARKLEMFRRARSFSVIDGIRNFSDARYFTARRIRNVRA